MLDPQLTYYSLGSGVTAFSTTRHGGHSIGCYGGMNVNAYCGDNPDNVSRNRQLLSGLLGISTERLVMPHQVHGTEIRQISEAFFSLSQAERQQQLEGVDAVMTDAYDVCIGVSTADCIPIIIYDAQHHAVCCIHSGWRGTVKRITRKAVATMMTVYGSQTAQLRAVVGPGISMKNFEVGNEVYAQFAEASFSMEHIARRYPAADGGEKWHIDLFEANRLQLHGAGLLPENIQVTGICTYEFCSDYFSARRLGVESGRIFTGALLRQGDEGRQFPGKSRKSGKSGKSGPPRKTGLAK
ncbi:MAG: peptidoglycan editing factor PgeF [Prevotella sp.]|nr:peptidoglycan editing factor PgeF [Prevotella sp.]